MPFPKLACALSQKLKWPHTIQEWQIMDEVSQILVVGNGARAYATSVLTHYPWGDALGMVLVDPNIQKSGMGTMMTKLALSLSHARKSESVVLTASHDAETLYQKVGFQRAGSIVVLKGKGGGEDSPYKVSCSAKDISKEFYQGCPTREKILERIIYTSPNSYCLRAADGGVEAFASSIRRIAPDGQESFALGPVLLRQPDGMVPLLQHFSKTSNVGLACFVFSGFNNEDERAKKVRSKIIDDFTSQGFGVVDEIQFMNIGKTLPTVYSDTRVVSPISLAFG